VKRYRSVLIGCGAIGSVMDERGHALGVQTHAAAYQAGARTELVGVCDCDPACVVRCGRTRGVPVRCTDHRELLELCKPEIVGIAVPTTQHAKILDDVLSFPGVQLVICEKPITSDSREARRLVEKAESTGCRLLVNYSRHYLLSMARVGSWIAQGRIGEFRLANAFYTKSVMHNGTHLIDLLRWWLGELRVVQACPAHWSGGMVEYCDVVFETSEGSLINMYALDAREYSLFEIDILGSAGRIKVTDGGDSIAIRGVRPHAAFPGYRELGPVLDEEHGCLRDMMLRVVDVGVDLLEGYESKTIRFCSGHDAVASMELAQQAMKIAGTER